MKNFKQELLKAITRFTGKQFTNKDSAVTLGDYLQLPWVTKSLSSGLPSFRNDWQCTLEKHITY